MQRSDKGMVFGRDLHCPCDRVVRVNGFSFPDHDDALSVGIADFQYRTFRICGEDGEFVLYESVVSPELGFAPVASVFCHDYSELDSILESVEFDMSAATLESGKPFSYERDLGEGAPFKDSEVQTVSRSFVIPKKTVMSPYMGAVKAYYDDALGLYVVCAEVDYHDFLFSQIRSFYGIENIIVVGYPKSSVETAVRKKIEKRYFFSVLRACLIALKACMKLSCEAVFEFELMYQTPQIDVERHSRIRRSIGQSGKETIEIQEDCLAVIHARNFNIFRKELVFSVLCALFPAYPVKRFTVKVMISGTGESYCTDPGTAVYSMVLAKTLVSQDDIMRKCGFPFVLFGFNKGANAPFNAFRLALSHQDRKVLQDALDDSQFEYARVLFGCDDRFFQDFSAASRLSRRTACLMSYSKQGVLDSNRIPFFEQVCDLEKRRGPYGMVGLTLVIADFNPLDRKLFSVSVVATAGEIADENGEKERIMLKIRKSMSACGISAGPGFERKSKIRLVRSQSGFSSASVIGSFILCIGDLMEDECELHNR